MNKKWYTSKMLWVNSIALVAIVIQMITGREAFNTEAQVSLLAVINIVLRLITNKPIEW